MSAPAKLPMKKAPMLAGVKKGPPLAGVKMPGVKTPGASPASSPGTTPRPGVPGKGVPPPPPQKGLPAKAGAPLAGMKAPPPKLPMKGAVGAPPPMPVKGAPAGPGSPQKLPMKAPLAVPGKLGLKAPPGAKLPMKAPAPAAANDAQPPAATPAAPGKAPLKLPLKAPAKAPLKLPLKKLPPPGSAGGDEPPLTGRTDMGGTREEDPNTPAATPRDMPQPGGGGDASPDGDDPLASVLGENDAKSQPSVPPTPRGEGESDVPPPPSAPPSAMTSPRNDNDSTGKDAGGAPSSPAAGPGGRQTPPPPPKPLDSNTNRPTVSVAEALMGAEWPTHALTTVNVGGDGNSGRVMRVPGAEELESQIRTMQRKAVESEQYINSLTNEISRLRETLYEREGVKVVQHIAELEKENRKLRLQLEKEKESRLYHQSAHLTIMDELIALRQTSDAGDFAKAKAENDRLQSEVTRLIQANTVISLKLADMTQQQQYNNNGGNDASGFPIVDLNNSTHMFVQVRRGALCRSCQDMVTRTEHALIKREQDAVMQSSGPPPSAYTSNSTFSLLTPGPSGESPAVVAAGWRALALPSGAIVYHNAVTNRSQWEMPPEMQMQQQQASQQQLAQAAYARVGGTPLRSGGGTPLKLTTLL